MKYPKLSAVGSTIALLVASGNVLGQVGAVQEYRWYHDRTNFPNGLNWKWQPEAGIVPDTATAMRIAEAVWIPMYGASHIAASRPFEAALVTTKENGVIWVVAGTLPKGMLGGTPYIEIRQRDGKVLFVEHSK